MYFGVYVKEIIEYILMFIVDGEVFIIKNDFVFVMIGYYFDYSFLMKMGV